MEQIITIDGYNISVNGENIFYAGLANSIAVSPDLKTVYIGSSVPDVRKYIKNYDINTGLSNWSLDKKFNINIDSLFVTGLYLKGSDLYISLADSNNNSKLMKVDANTGSHYYSKTSNINISTFYSSSSEGLTSMTSDDMYLYVANTGNYNIGKSINRISLDDNIVNVGWAKELTQAPIQLCIFEKYLCVLQSTLGLHIKNLPAANKQLVLLNLHDGSVAHTLDLPDSGYTNLGLSLVNNILSVIDSTVKPIYLVDLSITPPTVTILPTL